MKINGLETEHLKPAVKKYPFPLVFIHGMWGGGWMFYSWMIEAANEGWESWSLYLRNHDSHLKTGDISFADYAEDVKKFLGKIGRSILVGHSMGGLIAQRLASETEFPAAVFVTSAAPKGIWPLSSETMKRLPRYFFPIMASRPFLPRRGDLDALILNGLGKFEAECVYKKLVPESGRIARELAFSPPAVDETKVSCPTLVIGAFHDRITPAAMQEKIRDKYGADYFEADSAHLLMMEDESDKVIQKILAWLAAHI